MSLFWASCFSAALKWCRDNTRLYLCSTAKWKVLEACRQPCSDSSAQLCPSCKSWCVFWLVSNSWFAIPCWLVPKLSVSPSFSESAGLLMVLMLLSIARHWIFSFLVSDFSDCFKSFLMSKGKFYESSKDCNAIFLASFYLYACTVAKNSCWKLVHDALFFAIYVINVRDKSYVYGKSSLCCLVYSSYGYQALWKSTLMFYSCSSENFVILYLN